MSRAFRPSSALVAASCLAVVTVSVPVLADEDTPLPPDAALAKRKLSPWDQESARPFVAGRVDVGIVFARPAFMLGYGLPHWMWFGVETYALSTNSFLAAYAGIRASLPFLDMTIGARDTYSYRRSFLPVKSHYDAVDVDAAHGDRARYTAIDSELTLAFPAPLGFAFGSLLGTTLVGVPRGVSVFDEGMRVVMRAPAALDIRAGYLFGLGKSAAVKVGFLTETILLPLRDGPVVRVGPVASVTLTDHTEAVFVFDVVVKSPDTLGIWHGPYGFLGLRYRWAQGDEKPRFP